MKRILLASALAALPILSGIAQETPKMVPLQTELPKPLFIGTPVPVKLPNLEPATDKKRPDFLVPEGTTNLAAGKDVTSSDNEPLLGDLTLITDGDKAADEGCFVELASGKQWVQIDLGEEADIYAVMLWHFHSQARVYKGVVVQISDDPDFVKDVHTIYNNDYDNSLGFGEGKDNTYIETYEGRLIDAKGTKGRYVRLYSSGNTSTEMNHYIEVEVWGKPAA